MQRKVALVGNPNCGKTTLFNALTGATQHVGNWPGVTVEKKEGKLRGYGETVVVDLPGIYSLSPYTLEEVVARDFLTKDSPDAILNIVDGSNLERNLYLTTQVLELGIPVVVAVNMIDLVEKKGDVIDLKALSETLGCPCVEMSALKNKGVDEVARTVAELADKGVVNVRSHSFSSDVEQTLEQIEALIADKVPSASKRYFAVKMFERDAKLPETLNKVDVEGIITKIEETEEDDSESIIVNERYAWISSIIDGCCTRAKAKVSVSDKIDRVVTNRILALPIFVVVMFLVYYLAVTTVGTWGTDWANDGVFGDGWFISGDAEGYAEAADEYTGAQDTIAAYQDAAVAAGVAEEAPDPESETYEADLAEFNSAAAAAGVTGELEAYDDETGEGGIEEVDTAAYTEALEVAEPDPTTYGMWVPGIPVLIGNALEAGNVDPVVQALVLDGIVGGVGSVLGFVPQIMVLFLLLACLEACGYMARVAFILDRIFRRFGLSGKSFMPMLIATGCGVPGVMASRTIENENDRHMTVMTTTFMPCSAKLPIIALFAGAIFGGAWWVAPSAYFLGIAMILLTGIALKKTKPFAGKPIPFVMELPAYHLPTVGGVLRSMWERTWAFIKKAGTIIFVACAFIWFISSFGFVDGVFQFVEDQNDSMLAAFGNAVCWLFMPLGWGDWQAAAATITGLVAKENVVATFGILYAGDAGWYANVQAAYLPVAAYSFLVFNLLCAPCFAAMGAIKREMGGFNKWFWAAIGYECGIAYVVALFVFQFGGIVTGEATFGLWTIIAIILALGCLYMIFRPAKKYDDEGVSNLAVNAADAA